MQQGMLLSVLLSFMVFMNAAFAQEIPSERVDAWLADEQLNQKAIELLEYTRDDQIDSLSFALERLALPQQEAVKLLLLREIEQRQIILSSKMAMFVEQQTQVVPTYKVVEQGDGYELTLPAFDYPAVANRILRRWHQDQQTLEVILKAEQKALVLQDWLIGSEYLVRSKEKILIQELDSLSPEALDFITAQLTQSSVTSWLPSTQVMIRLAQVSQDEEVYKLLWRMRADFYSQAELKRLAKLGSDFSTQQLMLASSNPSLKHLALTELTQVAPMTDSVKAFLVTRMALEDEAPLIARELVRQGHSGWLRDLVSTNRDVKVNLIQQALAQ
ncbi:hypothetical protein [Vibrio mexicanus]|uniref:hypothetical protein n=1 Tax=Vibrio mexicanus TaxID=1004326 RepID=UPI00063CBAD7|nr:hypothetical protein [Vibrio mexicanus]